MSSVTEWILPFNKYMYNVPNDQANRRNNAVCVYGYMHGVAGWHPNAVWGLIGNLDVECTMNPTLWENETNPYVGPGFGLVQWTRFRKFTAWAHNRELLIYSPYAQMDKILDEVHNPTIIWTAEYGWENFGYQWSGDGSTYPSYIPRNATFEQFTTANNGQWTTQICAEMFLWYYEKPLNPVEGQRATRAMNYRTWYEDTYLAQGGTQNNYYPYPKYDDPGWPVRSNIPPWMIKQNRVCTRKGVIYR